MECHHCHHGEEERLIAYRRFVIAFILSLPFLIHMLGMLWGVHLMPPLMQFAFATVIQFWCGWPFYRASFESARKGQANMDLLIAIGTTAAYGFSTVAVFQRHYDQLYFESSVWIITLVLMGRWLEARSNAKTSQALEQLLQLQPAEAQLMTPEGIRKVAVGTVKVGDLLLVSSGDRIPVDGQVMEGTSSIDESMLTGESVPVFKKEAAAVFAGTVNLEGALHVRATRVGHETAVARIAHLVEEAQGSRAPIQRLADQISALFVPVVILISLATFLVWWALTGSLITALIPAVAVLVIACPCALGMATPTVIAVGTGRAAQAGILFKDATALEKSAQLNVLVTDKTGTLTEGKPSLESIIPSKGFDQELVLAIAASLETYSKHPFAEAVKEYAASKKTEIKPVSQFTTLPGKGVTGTIDGVRYTLGSLSYAQEQGLAVPVVANTHSILVLWKEQTLMGILEVSDPLRKSSQKAVALLHSKGIKLVMLTGDRHEVAESVAQAVGADTYLAGLLPDQKVAEIQRLKGASQRVGMVGDGINDAPALAAADVGFAISSGSEIAIETADVTLMRNDLMGVVDAMDLSALAMKKIRQNLFFAFIYNIIGIPIAALGWLNPIVAAAAMAFSSISVITNALTLRRWKANRTQDQDIRDLHDKRDEGHKDQDKTT